MKINNTFILPSNNNTREMSSRKADRSSKKGKKSQTRKSKRSEPAPKVSEISYRRWPGGKKTAREKQSDVTALSQIMDDDLWKEFDQAMTLDDHLLSDVQGQIAKSKPAVRQAVPKDNSPALVDRDSVEKLLRAKRSDEVELVLGAFIDDNFESGITVSQYTLLVETLDFYREHGMLSGQSTEYIVESGSVAFPNVRRITGGGRHTFQRKEVQRSSILSNRDWGYRIRIASETDIDFSSHDERRFNPTLVREITRTSYHSANSMHSIYGFRIDLSVVRQTSDDDRFTRYELEIERFDDAVAKMGRGKEAQLAINLEYALKLVLLISQGFVPVMEEYLNDRSYANTFPLSLLLDAERYSAVVSYINQHVTSRVMPRIDGAFVNKPSNLKITDLLSGTEYAITSKLDGTRRFAIFIEGAAYLFNPPLDVEFVGAAPDVPTGTIIDGEFMDRVESDDPLDDATGGIDQFWAFDCLFYGDRDVRRTALATRLEHLSKVIKTSISTLKGRRRIAWIEKPYRMGPLRQSIAFVLTMNSDFESRGIPTDGIIFQPVKMPYKNTMTRKWKAPEDLTIDFVAKLDDGAIHLFSAGDRRAGGRALVRFSPSELQDLSLSRDAVIVRRQTVQGAVEESAIDRIAEYSWTGSTFTVRRLRPDKSDPNALAVALDVWADIMNPLTRDMFATDSSNLQLVQAYHREKIAKMITENTVSSGTGAMSVGIDKALLPFIVRAGVSTITVTNATRQMRSLNIDDDIRVIYVKRRVSSTRAVMAFVEGKDIKIVYVFSVERYIDNSQITAAVETIQSCLGTNGLVLGSVTETENTTPSEFRRAFIDRGFDELYFEKASNANARTQVTEMFSEEERKYDDSTRFFAFSIGDHTVRPVTSTTDDVDEEPSEYDETATEVRDDGGDVERYVETDDKPNFFQISEGERVNRTILGYKTVIIGALMDESSILRAVVTSTDENYRRASRVAFKTGERPTGLDVSSMRQAMAEWLTPVRFARLAEGGVQEREMRSVVSAGAVAIHRLRNTQLNLLRRRQYEEIKQKHAKRGLAFTASFFEFRDEFTEEENRRDTMPATTIQERAYISYISKLTDPAYSLGETVLEILEAYLDMAIIVVSGQIVTRKQSNYQNAVVIYTTDRVFYHAIGIVGRDTTYVIDRSPRFEQFWN